MFKFSIYAIVYSQMVKIMAFRINIMQIFLAIH